MVFLLAIPALALWRLQFVKHHQYAAGLSSGLMAVSMLATLYHHVYDALLLFPARLWVDTLRTKYRAWFAASATGLGSFAAVGGLELPRFRDVSQASAAQRQQHRMLTSIGPVAMTAAWLGLCALPGYL